jgi:hypothetical protein
MPDTVRHINYCETCCKRPGHPLFADIQRSARLWEWGAKDVRRALARHDEILKGVVEADGGWYQVFEMVGDACHGAFLGAPGCSEPRSPPGGRSLPSPGTRGVA